MRAIEADWIRDQLLALGPSAASPVANLGSSTHQFRTVQKPHIEERLFKPLRAAGFHIVHLDMKAAEGVDIVADLTREDEIARVAAMNFKSVICSNMLEHIEQPSGVAASCERIVPGGTIIVTVPLSYPYHPDPIDTMYRPTPGELAQLFTASTPIDTTILTDGIFFREELRRGPVHMLTLPLRWSWHLFSGLWRPQIARACWARIRHQRKPISVSCATLRAGMVAPQEQAG